ncbi:hypothetical protein [Aeromonas phage vB_AsaM_LPM4]|uniref:Uncharacterized protein n=1 Tax=Aeromonas phage vB_AsaM_LPM4 TaxID=2894367 RepID=A0AAE8YH94_9CAUD|nr:hypothetical protein PQA71_gp34 [Aeromonas phage vB_AsaM_LPM4]UGC97291.1 hypothetical protein [Aeromonas phage vB_AsaM_LPM4]
MLEGIILPENKYISAIDFDSARPDREQPVDFGIAHRKENSALIMGRLAGHRPSGRRDHLLHTDAQVHAEQNGILQVNEPGHVVIKPAPDRARVNTDQPCRIGIGETGALKRRSKLCFGIEQVLPSHSGESSIPFHGAAPVSMGSPVL